VPDGKPLRGVDYAGNVVVSTNPTGGATAWTVLHLHMGHLAAVSCPDANLCVATDEAGDVIVSTDPTGAARRGSGSPTWAVSINWMPPG